MRVWFCSSLRERLRTGIMEQLDLVTVTPMGIFSVIISMCVMGGVVLALPFTYNMDVTAAIILLIRMKRPR